jgi:hypothetical protein
MASSPSWGVVVELWFLSILLCYYRRTWADPIFVHFGTYLGVIGGLLSYTLDFIVSGPSPRCPTAGSTLDGPEREGR